MGFNQIQWDFILIWDLITSCSMGFKDVRGLLCHLFHLHEYSGQRAPTNHENWGWINPRSDLNHMTNICIYVSVYMFIYCNLNQIFSV